MAKQRFFGKARTLDALSNATNEKKEEKEKERKNSKAQKDKTKEHSTNAENVEVVEGNKPGKYKVDAVKVVRFRYGPNARQTLLQSSISIERDAIRSEVIWEFVLCIFNLFACSIFTIIEPNY